MSRRGDPRDRDDVIYESREEKFVRGPPPPRPEQLPRAPMRERFEEDVYIRRGGPPSERERSRSLRDDDVVSRRGERTVVEEDSRSYVRRGPSGPPPDRRRWEDDDRGRRGPPPPPAERREVIEEEVVNVRAQSRGPPPRGNRGASTFVPPPPSNFDRGFERMPDRGTRPPAVRDRSPSSESDRRGPSFLRDDYGRTEHNSSLVIRRQRSVSPVRYSERVVTRRSQSQSRSPPPPVLRRRVVEESTFRRRTPSPPPVSPPRRVVERWTEVRRPSPPPPMETIRYREREVREEVGTRPSSSSGPSLRSISPPAPAPYSPPQPNYAPPIHQEIITHHRHIDHGFERAPRPASPPPPPPSEPRRREKERTTTTEIDIHEGRGNLEVDIKKSSNRSRAASPATTHRSRADFYEDDRVRITNDRMEVRRRRSTSAKSRRDINVDIRETTREPSGDRIRDDELEAAYYARKTDERAYIGEAYRGATKDWAIVDVPPGTERVVMDGVGGASQEITWQKYNGVRRSRFIAERDEAAIRAPSPPPRAATAIEPPPPRPKSTGMELEIRTRTREGGGGGDGVYEREYERIEETGLDRRVGFPNPPPRTPPRRREKDLWTEITKDLVVREAIEELGYDYDETPEFFYIISYLRYEDVQELVDLSDHIRRKRQQRLDDIARERERIKRADEDYKKRKDRGGGGGGGGGYDDERIFEREIIYERGGPPRRSKR